MAEKKERPVQPAKPAEIKVLSGNERMGATKGNTLPTFQNPPPPPPKKKD